MELDFSKPGYHLLCLNTPHPDVLLAQMKEVCENYDADGIFLDILGVRECHCEYCTNQLLAEGKNPNSRKDILDLSIPMRFATKRRCP